MWPLSSSAPQVPCPSEHAAIWLPADVPDVEWYYGTDSTPPPDDIRTPAFARLVPLYQSFLPRGCVDALAPNESYKCELPHYSYPHLT